ncbi:DEKNAAC101977 [Brettanomyces naardenensis]|uniref:DEKNAAC101977 n=1 Tax=Brettanomyces naardenensis TaxID=13370 RepID=A0A448YJI4_BRENA|nr:DEKNAAC101977 [Brettanomyces naardenensis]
MALESTAHILEVLGSTKTFYKCLRSIPDIEVQLGGLQDAFSIDIVPREYDPRMDRLDLLIKKSTLIQSFAECYEYLYQESHAGRRKETSLATLGILLVTPEDHTALILNEELLLTSPVSKMKIITQFNVICSYLTSSLARTNKSSSLWLYFKKLLITMLNFDDESYTLSSISKIALRIIIMSMEVHPRNYYACNTLRFLVAIIRRRGSSSPLLLKEYYAAILEYLKNDGLNDTSMWLVLVQLLVRLDAEDYYVSEFLRLGFEMEPDEVDNSFSLEEIKSIKNEIFDWLVSSNYRYHSGWLALVLISDRIGEGAAMKDFLHASVLGFEKEEKCRISTDDGSMLKLTGEKVELDSNLLLKERFAAYLTFKRLYEATEGRRSGRYIPK